MLLFFAVVIPAVFMLALWHREQTEALEVRMSPANAELQSVVGREAKIAQQDTLAGSSVGDGGAADGAARIVSSSVPQPAERAMPPKQTATSVPIRAPSDASTASRDAGGVRHAADQPPRAAAKSAGAARAEQSQRRPLTRAQAAATQGSSAGIASRSSEQAGPTGPVTVAAESDGIQRDLEIITAIVRASSR
ncbi:hypothetical protein AZKH_1752 [Azoarcus sp. KH32C]|nr:hypothetical protein AZKH_1752 [Azoarcus sp. KH32C]